MVRGEISVTCPGCGAVARMPTSALQRDNYYCSRCGKHIPLGGVKLNPTEEDARPARSKKRPYRPPKRR